MLSWPPGNPSQALAEGGVPQAEEDLSAADEDDGTEKEQKVPLPPVLCSPLTRKRNMPTLQRLVRDVKKKVHIRPVHSNEHCFTKTSMTAIKTIYCIPSQIT
jgi:hypothetical protein